MAVAPPRSAAWAGPTGMVPKAGGGRYGAAAEPWTSACDGIANEGRPSRVGGGIARASSFFLACRSAFFLLDLGLVGLEVDSPRPSEYLRHKGAGEGRNQMFRKGLELTNNIVATKEKKRRGRQRWRFQPYSLLATLTNNNNWSYMLAVVMSSTERPFLRFRLAPPLAALAWRRRKYFWACEATWAAGQGIRKKGKTTD